MSLVAYGSSEEESDHESEVDEKVESDVKNVKTMLSKEMGVKQFSTYENKKTTNSSVSPPSSEDKFVNLPPPKMEVQDISWNLLPFKKSSLPVRIMAPELTELPAEEKEKKVIKPSTKGCGLFAILPSPKQQTILRPQSIQKPKTSKTNQTNEVKKPIPKKPTVSKTRASTDAGSLKLEYSDSEDDEESGPVNFFNFSGENAVTSTKEPEIPKLETVNFPSKSSISAPEISMSPGRHSEAWMNQEKTIADVQIDTISDQHVKLDDAALTYLCGSRAKRKKVDEMQIIDVDGSSLIPDSKDWLMKELSQEQARYTHKRSDNPTTQQRRKHQITYLAFQAKEQELELKNQWANNRMTKKQTQAKYGF